MDLKKWRLIWLIGLAMLIIAILFLSISPFGKTSYKTDFIKDSYFFGKLSPQERIKIDNQIKFVGEPVYFSLFTHRRFNKASLTIDFASPPKLLEIGLRRDKAIWNFDLKPLYASSLEELGSSENTIFENGVMLWQKNKKYNSIEDFLRNLPAAQSIISYRYPLANNFKTQDSGRGDLKNYELGLRGGWQFYTYSSGQAIELSLDIKDRNEATKPFDTELNIYKGNELIASQKISDEQKQIDRQIVIKSSNLEAGVYRVELKADDDIISERLKTAQRKISFIGRLWLVEAGTFPRNLYSDSETFTAQTNNPSAKQSLIIDGKNLAVNETYKQFVLSTNDTSRRLKEIIISHSDIILAGDGTWSFSKDSFFDPSLRTLTAASKKDSLGADYLIAAYKKVENLGNGSYRAIIDFDLNQAYREDGKYAFMISAPMADLSKQPLIIENIKIDFYGDSVFKLLSKIWQKRK